MTRVILTNKKTGQALPEAELLYKDSPTAAYALVEIQFDGTSDEAVFKLSEWNVTDVAPAPVYGDVYRRVDRADSHAEFVIAVHLGTFGWHEINPIARQINPINQASLDRYVGVADGKWELV